jgi:hypothetical protein
MLQICVIYTLENNLSAYAFHLLSVGQLKGKFYNSILTHVAVGTFKGLITVRIKWFRLILTLRITLWCGCRLSIEQVMLIGKDFSIIIQGSSVIVWRFENLKESIFLMMESSVLRK